MEIKEMNLADTEARMSELDSLVETSENPEEIEGYTEELRSLKEHKAELEALEERKANAKALEEDRATDTVKEIETRKESETMKTIEEYRNSEEYVNAFAEYIKTGDAEELRALLTTNVGAAGEVAVPDMVYDIIKTDWAKTSVMSLVKKISVQGNMKVQFELSAGDAVIHNEGSGAVSEEELTLGVVTLIPESIKKWISVSDEVQTAQDLFGPASADVDQH
jgi:HK97 family phage major capsid protein